MTVSKCSNMFAQLEVVEWPAVSFISTNESVNSVCLCFAGKRFLVKGEGRAQTISGPLLSLNLVLSVRRNPKRRMMIIRMQERSQISSAVTELEIGAENLKIRMITIQRSPQIWAPRTIEHVEEEEADSKQETNPGQNSRQQEQQLHQVQFYKNDLFPKFIPSWCWLEHLKECRQKIWKGWRIWSTKSQRHTCYNFLKHKAINITDTTYELTFLPMPNPPTEVNLPDICLELKIPLDRSLIGILTIDLDLAQIIANWGKTKLL